MESIKEIFRIGYGPSSSHTMGPRKAAIHFREKYPDAVSYKVKLYGSLAATGKGHQTDKALMDELSPKEVAIEWYPEILLPEHPNGLEFIAMDENKNEYSAWKVFSIGGGKITDFSDTIETKKIYNLTTMTEILQWCRKTGYSLWEYVEQAEGSAIYEHLEAVWSVMKESVKRGIETDGIIPGGLGLARKSSAYYVKAKNYKGSLRQKTLVFSYALAVAEENASGGKIVTAPTCGSCGVLPAVLCYLQESFEFSDQKMLKALATAGLIGNLIKHNASISGAEVGCQGEIGAACSMASGAVTQLLGGTPAQIEYAAEMGMEHHLGLTCDPINGLVQVPCIERNAFAAERSLNTATYSLLSDGRHLVSFDKIVETMKRTGHDIPSIYRETSEGGMAILNF